MRHEMLMVVVCLGCAEERWLCIDGEQDGRETGVDCGGGCAPCAHGSACRASTDCASRSCQLGRCVATAECGNGIQDLTETDRDCGGASCPACGIGRRCAVATDCATGVCGDGRCRIQRCLNHTLDPGETDVDCGGAECQPCRAGLRCAGSSDCANLVCTEGTCTVPGCENGRVDGSETDVDCGGDTCRECALGLRCARAGDCASGHCGDGKCALPPCSNGRVDPGETDVDCGGTTCDACALGKRCAANTDCFGDALCDAGVCKDPFAPDYGPTVSQVVAPPPVSGGTLVVARDGKSALVSDPDRDQVWLVDLGQRAVVAAFALLKGDEPGRLVEDGGGRVHVALRRGGAIVDLDRATLKFLGKRSVCAAPRGIAWDPNGDRLHVACAGGELVTLPAGGGAATRVVRLPRDLRDVIVEDDRLYVSRLVSAEVLVLDGGGKIVERLSPPTFSRFSVRGGSTFGPAVAWRAVAAPGGGVLVVHQRGVDNDRQGQFGGGGGGWDGDPNPPAQECATGVLHSAVSRLRPGDARAGPALPRAVLPVDVAVKPGSNAYVIVAAGNALTPALPQVLPGTIGSQADCEEETGQVDGTAFDQPTGQAVAAAFSGAGELLVQTREPATIQVLSGQKATIVLSKDSRADTGHAIFHGNSGGLVACASCHPEGGDDGRTWSLPGQSALRTLSLRGGILGRAPFHWDGTLKDLGALVDEVFVGRMGGAKLDGAQLGALSKWVDAVPPLPQSSPPDAASAARGKKLFDDPKVGCAGCHSGPLLTIRALVDVGTGGTFKVPSLIGIGWRAPLIHNGCAATLRDRFGPCGGGDQHGKTSHLTEGELQDLIAHLETL